MRSDKELLDALESEGCGVALVHDDAEHWFVVTDGMQSIVQDGPAEFQTSYWITKDELPRARKTVREAIDAWIDLNEIETTGDSNG